jgi:hypothetical protein
MDLHWSYADCNWLCDHYVAPKKRTVLFTWLLLLFFLIATPGAFCCAGSFLFLCRFLKTLGDGHVLFTLSGGLSTGT